MLSGKRIRNDVAMTGEINLKGNITEIGGLEQKIMGGIRAGVKTFLYPKQNVRDFDKFMEKYADNKLIQRIQFISVSEIAETFPYLYVDDTVETD